MTRRKLITLLGSLIAAPVAHPFVARADRTRRIGLLINLRSDDPEGQNRLMAFVQALQKFGWTEGSNIHIDLRWASDDADLSRRYAEELVALAPDVLLASGTQAVVALQKVTRSVPIVFVNATDPVGAGFVSSVARPGGNTTGFAAFEYGLSVKWLELLKQVAPRVTRVAVLRDSLTPVGIGQLAAIQGVAPSFGVELTPLVVRDADEIEPAVAAFARGPDDGLIVTIGTLTDAHRDVIGKLAARYRLPAVYPFPFFVRSGGLISYGTDIIDLYRRAAGYVDRILKGEKPADLPVQQPTKIQLAINLKAAKALGLEVPPTLLAHADEVIE